MDCGQLFGSLKPVNQNLGVKRGGQRTWERNVLEAGHTNHPPPPHPITGISKLTVMVLTLTHIV